MQKFEKSLTPAQRARLKVYWHLFMTALLAGALAALGLVDQFKTIDVRTLAIAIGSGIFLAFADGLRKYYQASGEVQKAAGIAGLETLVAQKAPSLPKADATGQVLEQTAQAFITPPVSASASNPAVQDSIETQSTLPNLDAIKKQFTTPGA